MKNKLLMVFSFLVLGFLLSGKGAFAWEKCFVGTKQVGYINVTNTFPPYDFLLKGSQGSVMFYDFSGDVRGDEIYFKLGKSGWTALQQRNGQYLTANISTGTDTCGRYWANVMWRSKTDSKLHYCSQLINKYAKGPVISNFVTSSCLSTTCQYNSDPNARTAYISGEVTFPGTNIDSCKGYSFNLNGKQTPFNFSTSGKCAFYGFFAPTLSGGRVEAKVSPVPAVFTSAKGNLELFDFISDSYCGGNLR